MLVFLSVSVNVSGRPLEVVGEAVFRTSSGSAPALLAKFGAPGGEAEGAGASDEVVVVLVAFVRRPAHRSQEELAQL